MYIRGASSVQCSVCSTVNLAVQGAHLLCSKLLHRTLTPLPRCAANQIAHVNCGGCGITLMCVPRQPQARFACV